MSEQAKSRIFWSWTLFMALAAFLPVFIGLTGMLQQIVVVIVSLVSIIAIAWIAILLYLNT